MSGEASAAFWAWVEALREEHLKFSGFIPKEITALDAWRACWAQKDAELAALRIENDTLRAELESAHAAQRHAENELSQYMAWYAMAEHQHLHEQRRAEKAEADAARLQGCREELREIAEAISDPRLHNTMTIAEWCRSADKLAGPVSDLPIGDLTAFGDVLGHNYWMEASTFARLRRRIIEHWQRAALAQEGGPSGE